MPGQQPGPLSTIIGSYPRGRGLRKRLALFPGHSPDDATTGRFCPYDGALANESPETRGTDPVLESSLGYTTKKSRPGGYQGGLLWHERGPKPEP